MPRVETLEEFMIQAISDDNQLFERCQKKQLDLSNIYQSIDNISSKASGTSSSGTKPI